MTLKQTYDSLSKKTDENTSLMPLFFMHNVHKINSSAPLSVALLNIKLTYLVASQINSLLTTFLKCEIKWLTVFLLCNKWQ
jgi:hypothetical protein